MAPARSEPALPRSVQAERHGVVHRDGVPLLLAPGTLLPLPVAEAKEAEQGLELEGVGWACSCSPRAVSTGGWRPRALRSPGPLGAVQHEALVGF